MNTMQRRVFVAIFCLLAIIISGLVRTKLPDAATRANEPFEYRSEAPRFGTVSNVSTSASTELEGVHTSGIFLHVTFDFTPNSREASPQGTLIDAKKRQISSTTAFFCPPLQNGLTGTCEAVFEMQPEALEGSAVRFRPGFTETSGPVIVTDLGIDSARASQLQGEAQ